MKRPTREATRRRRLHELKGAARLLPIESILRRMILAEPDFLDESEFSAKAETWVRALFAEEAAAKLAQLAVAGTRAVRVALTEAGHAPRIET